MAMQDEELKHYERKADYERKVNWADDWTQVGTLHDNVLLEGVNQVIVSNGDEPLDRWLWC